MPGLTSSQYVATYELSSSALVTNFQFYTIHFDGHAQKEVLDLSIMKATTYTFYNEEAEDSVFVLLNTTFDPEGEGKAGYVRSTVNEFFSCKKANITSILDTLGYDRLLLKDMNGESSSLAIQYHDSGHLVRSLLCTSAERMPLINYAILKTKRGTVRLRLVDLSETSEYVKLPPRSKIGREISYDTWCYLKKHEGGFGGF